MYPSPEAPFEGIFAARKWEGMVERGHDVRVAVPLPWAPPWSASLLSEERARVARAPRTETRSGVPASRPRFLHVPTRGTGNAARFARAGVREIFGEGPKPDVAVLDYAWPAAAAAASIAGRGVPVVINGRGSDVLQVRDVPGLRAGLADGLSRASALTAVSRDLLDAMCALRSGDGPAVLTPNGVDAERFAPGSQEDARRRLGLDAGGEVVLVVGHLIERKDPLLALRAFRAAKRERARLVFVGRGPLEGDVRREASELGLAGRVELMGERPPEELADWYRAADLLLLTSSREGRPNVVLEALSCGTPVLATDAGGTSEVVPDPSRMLCTTREADAIAVKVRALLDDPPDGQELRSSVEPLSWATSLDALESLLASLVR